MIGDNEVKDSRGVRLLSEISLYVVYRVDTRQEKHLYVLRKQGPILDILMFKIK
jgi:hypothetical protein